MTDMEMTD